MLKQRLDTTLGIEYCSTCEFEGKRRVTVTYNCEIIKGTELSEIISGVDNCYTVINDRINSFSKRAKAVQ